MCLKIFLEIVIMPTLSWNDFFAEIEDPRPRPLVIWCRFGRIRVCGHEKACGRPWWRSYRCWYRRRCRCKCRSGHRYTCQRRWVCKRRWFGRKKCSMRLTNCRCRPSRGWSCVQLRLVSAVKIWKDTDVFYSLLLPLNSYSSISLNGHPWPNFWSKAFECIRRDLWIANLSANDFDENTLTLIYSYLKWHQPSATINNTYSTFQNKVSRAPQGAMLSPMPFNF